ncbi:hypothetical protein AYO42_06575 [Rhizomicrobium sp. SCGC AG-212-E05]|nr:hypothetical protein AYO42_06575 [Rhizomicrobium sp. SCGC AG-212-E05]
MMGTRRVLKHLVLIALIVRALVPAGWMPIANADTLITICSIEGKKVLHPDAPAKDMASEECAFGAAPHIAFIPDAPVLTAPAVHAHTAKTDRVYAASIVARFTPQSPRAPPLNA